VTTELTTCYRHPDRRAGVRCQRCSRWICPDCMVQASVGFHCPECSRTGRQQVRTGRQAFTSAAFTPIVTYVLIALNALVFLIDLVQGAELQGTGGGLAIDGGLLGAGFSEGQLIGVAEGEWWRLVTGGFLHGGLLHIGLNMLMLYLLGPLLERELGKLNFGLLYATSLIAGSLGVMLLSPFDLTVGASGALYGLLGAAVALQLSRGINPWTSGIGGLILINVLITFTIPGISIGGHLGGLIGGFVAGWVLVNLDQRLPSRVVAPAICAGLLVGLFALSIWAADYAVTTGHAVIDL
jgi:membrane associated rhomboid family serine protease